MIKLPPIISEFVNVHSRLVAEWADTGLKFTLDGRLVGDIAEAVAAQEYKLEFPSVRTPGVDLLTKSGKTVQVKASGIGKGPAFTPGEGTADYLIFMLLHFDDCCAEIVYNGPEEPVRNELPIGFSGTKRVSLSKVIWLNELQELRLPQNESAEI